jgi:hypothetical protein
VSGLVLVALALFAIWLTRDLPQGTLRAMGPAMLPRWLAIGVGLCGVALVAISLFRHGDPLERFTFRGPLVVAIAILCFGVTIRGFNLGGIQVPLLGLMVSGPLAIFISGFASPEARLRDLLILALALTAFCMALFGDLLNLPIRCTLRPSRTCTREAGPATRACALPPRLWPFSPRRSSWPPAVVAARTSRSMSPTIRSSMAIAAASDPNS